MYSDMVTTVQSATIPSHFLAFEKEKLKTEIQRRTGNCEILIGSTSL